MGKMAMHDDALWEVEVSASVEMYVEIDYTLETDPIGSAKEG